MAARVGFRRRYRTGNGTLSSDSQAAYSIAIVFGLFDDDELAAAGRNLARLVHAADLHLTTGFLGTPVILDALTRTGNTDLAFALLTQRTVPSWLYPVTMGATTIWERWDSMLPSGEVNPGDMTSFNHFAFRPGAHEHLGSARAAHVTPHGMAEISWRRETAGLSVDITVPFGAMGVLEMPGEAPRALPPGRHVIGPGGA